MRAAANTLDRVLTKVAGALSATDSCSRPSLPRSKRAPANDLHDSDQHS
ncbi:hypothetical protein SM0020_32597 [Sinorhizobium meliloti CCNWSX0020]|uniref:Uncharacterized protein n=1 Tax=Sinorhizobium meliloti CCNWSX0020 TaxID=1107881 RepID=H0GAG0_RHIML|nr:hypothetical protein SM0020_32597 [Sinorhizobium meliloti CCNWSX0020]